LTVDQVIATKKAYIFGPLRIKV